MVAEVGRAASCARCLSAVSQARAGSDQIPIGLVTLRTVSQDFVDLLDRLGYDSYLKVVCDDWYIAAIDDPTQQVQIGYASWASDIWPSRDSSRALTCTPAGVGPGFCDPIIDRRIEQAVNMQATDPAASHDLWSDIDHDLTDRAARVPLRNVIGTNLVSERLGKYRFHPFWLYLYDQMWVQ